MDNAGKQVIPSRSVRRIPQPVMVDCGSAAPGGGRGPIVVVPLMDGDRVAGLEIRCGCGSATIVECIYQDEEKS